MIAAIAAILLNPRLGFREPVASVTLMAVGDVMLDRFVGRAIDRFGPRYPFARVRKTLNRANIVYANLECPLTTEQKVLAKRFVFRVKPGSVGVFNLKPLTVLSTANNHSLDCGRKGLAQTLETLDRHHLQHAGAGSTEDAAWQPLIVQRKGLKVAFIAVSDFPETVAGDSPVVCYYDEARLKTSIQRARKSADIVVVCPHWGIEDTTVTSERVKREARLISDDGADLILGCHPHVLQSVTWLTRPDGGRTCVAFSMGNFVFDTTRALQTKTGIFSFTLNRRGVSASKLLPATIVNCQPRIDSSPIAVKDGLY